MRHVDDSYSQVAIGALTDPGETSQRHRGSMGAKRAVTPNYVGRLPSNPPVGGWQQTNLCVAERATTQ